MKRLLTGIAFALIAVPALLAEEGGFDVNWTATERPDEAKPAWKLLGGGKGEGGKAEVSLVDGALVLVAPTQASVGGARHTSHSYTIDNPKYWKPGAQGSTVELRLKVDSVAEGADYAAAIGFITESRTVRFTFDTQGVTANDGQHADVETGSFKTYRIVDDPAGNISLYVEGVEEPLIETQGQPVATASRYIYFGVPFLQGAGESRWEFVRFTNLGIR